MKKLLGLSIFTLAFFFSASSASAAGQCQVIYGGGEVCPTQEFTINKMVQKPNVAGDYVENLSIYDPKYAPDTFVNFRVEIKNTTNNSINRITVTDSFPEFLTYLQGVGTYDASRRTLTFTVDNLDAGKNQVFTIVAKTAVTTKLPQDKGVICITNNVKADADTISRSDSSQLCIEKKVLGQVMPAPVTTSTPATGAGLLTFLGLISAGLAGVIIRKTSQLSFK